MNAESAIEIREYRPEDEPEWMRVHAIIMSISHAWNYTIQERPEYEGYEAARLVLFVDGNMAGLTDIQYENEPGELCFLDDSRGGYVLEFGRLPEYKGLNLGQRLIDASVEDAKKRGVRRLEYWTQDRAAQRYYARLGLTQINRHYRFRMKPPPDIEERMTAEGIGVEYLYGACLPEAWPGVQERYDIIKRHPLEPHLQIGYELRF